MKEGILINENKPSDKRIIHIDDGFMIVQLEGDLRLSSKFGCKEDEYLNNNSEFEVPVYLIIKKVSVFSDNDPIPIGDYIIFQYNRPDSPHWRKIPKKNLEIASKIFIE